MVLREFASDFRENIRMAVEMGNTDTIKVLGIAKALGWTFGIIKNEY